MIIKLKINGAEVEKEIEPRMILSDFIRDVLNLKGTNVSCGVGVCGACTVLLNGKPAKSCILLAAMADGSEITTVEGLSSNGRLNVVQEAFWEHHAVQCGFCTSGFLMAAYALLKENNSPSEDEIKDYLSGNLCRCTGYVNIIEAVKAAAEKVRNMSPSEFKEMFRW